MFTVKGQQRREQRSNPDLLVKQCDTVCVCVCVRRRPSPLWSSNLDYLATLLSGSAFIERQIRKDHMPYVFSVIQLNSKVEKSLKTQNETFIHIKRASGVSTAGFVIFLSDLNIVGRAIDKNEKL